MNEREMRQVLELGDKRNDLLYPWLRWLIVFAAGSLAVLVSLHGDKPFHGIPGIMMKASWLLLGAGVVFGTFALYIEVWTARRILKEFVRRKRERDLNGVETAPRSPIVVTAPRVLRLCEPACYVSLLGAVVALMAYIVFK